MANAINGVKTASSALEKSTAVLAVISSGIQIVSGIFGSIGENKRAAKEFRQEVADLNRELEQLKIDAQMETQGTIFGDDTWTTAIKNIQAAREGLERYNEALENTKNRDVEFTGSLSKVNKDFDSAAESIAKMQVKTGTKGWWFWKKNTYDSLKTLVPELFGDDGQLNMDALTEFVDGNSKVYQGLTDSNKAYLQEMVDAWGNYQEALENVNDYLTDIFGQLGSNISDALADAFANGTDAAESFADSVSDMMEKMAKNIAYSAMLQPLFEEAQKEFESIFGPESNLSDTERFDKASGVISDLIDNVNKGTEDYNKLLEQFQQIAEEKGIDIFHPDTESSQSGTSRGFATMSQDTASELNGRFTDIQGKINILVEQSQFGRSLSIEQLNMTTDMRDIMIQINGNVADIRTFTKVLPEMSNKLDQIARNTANL